MSLVMSCVPTEQQLEPAASEQYSYLMLKSSETALESFLFWMV